MKKPMKITAEITLAAGETGKSLADLTTDLLDFLKAAGLLEERHLATSVTVRRKHSFTGAKKVLITIEEHRQEAAL